MKKIKLLFLSLLLSGMVIAQPVSSTAVIPIGVTLNSILRLNVVSGGNIEFVVNSIEQYKNGITNASNYDTQFNVASSVDFNVLMYAEDAELYAQGVTTNTVGAGMPLANIGYVMEVASGGGLAGTTPATDNWAFTNGATIAGLTNTATTAVVTSHPGNGAGGTIQNNFIINWELATPAMITATIIADNLLTQSLPSDRYVVNVFLVLEAQ